MAALTLPRRRHPSWRSPETRVTKPCQEPATCASAADYFAHVRTDRPGANVATLPVLVILLAACGGSSGPVTSPSPAAPAFGPVDSVLVGNWSGSVDGSFGPGTFSMTLAADGSIRTAGSGNYCAFTGRWGVTSGQFTASGPDCTGTIVTLTAPVSSTVLSGVWTASSGRSGTFACTKE